MNSKRLTRSEVLLLLLNAPGLSGVENEPIKGRTKLQKLLFLIQKSIPKNSLLVSYPFRPFKYGPFCKEVYDDLQFLKEEGLIKEEKEYLKEKGIYVKFKLTEKGQQKARELANTPEGIELVKVVTDIKKKFNHMTVADLVEFTHEQYPGYVLEEDKSAE
jgi:uncharacterized protein YwgA